ncbi:MAG: HEAT repeat protein [Planctomycetota bacterium]|jgi:HEAT repeat protein
MIEKRDIVARLALSILMAFALSGFAMGQVIDSGGGAKPKPARGGYRGPGGNGKRGGWAPSGGGKRAPFAPGGNGERPGGNSEPGGDPAPTPAGPSGGGNGGTNGGTNGSGSGGASTGGTPGVGGAAPGKAKRGGATGALRQGVDEVSWQNWWVLNEAHYLDLERRYQLRHKNVEKNRDLFTGEDATDQAVLIDANDEVVVKKALPLLESLLKHDSHLVRVEAALAIGRIGGAEQVSWLTPFTKDKHRDVRKAAILGLGLLQQEGALPMLKFLSRDRGTTNMERAYAAVSIGLVGKLESTKFLIERLEKGRRVRDVDAALIYALGMLQTPRARRYLDYYVAHPLRDTTLRAVAVDALALHQSVQSLDTIKRALKDQDVRVRRSAAAALGQVDFSSRYRSEWEELERAFNGDDTSEEFSSRVIGELAAYQARLRVKLETDESMLSDKKSSVLDLIEKHGLEDSDVLVRNFCAISLGEIGGKRAVGILNHQVQNARLNSTRSFAALALAISGDKTAGQTLHRRLIRKRLNQETKAAFDLALGLAGEKDAKGLIKKHFRSSGDTAIAKYSAIALALLEDKTVQKPIRDRLLQKSRPELKRAYGQSLAILGDYDVVDILGKVLKRHGSVAHKVQLFSALSAIQDTRSLELLIENADSAKRKRLSLAAVARAIGMVAERGDRPILTKWFRHLNYQLRIVPLNEIALL